MSHDEIPPAPVNDPNAIWDWALKLAKHVAEVSEKRREARRLRRNERARERYKLNKLVPKKPKPEPEPERDYEPPDSCQCQFMNHPPCSWCTDPERTEEDFN